jgi:hypothetical protein
MAKKSKTPQEFFADFMMGGVSCVPFPFSGGDDGSELNERPMSCRPRSLSLLPRSLAMQGSVEQCH